jgi:hypothetical protein
MIISILKLALLKLRVRILKCVVHARERESCVGARQRARIYLCHNTELLLLTFGMLLASLFLSLSLSLSLYGMFSLMITNNDAFDKD